MKGLYAGPGLPSQDSVMRRNPDTQPNSTPERRGDRYGWFVVIGFTLLSLLVEGTTRQMEITRQGVGFSGERGAEWLYALSSHIVLIGVSAIAPIWLTRFPISLSQLWSRLPIYGLGFVIFTLAHVLLMVGIRQIVFPMITGTPYDFGLSHWEPWAYEARKDLFTFLSVLGVFMAARQIAVLQEERRAAQADAEATGQLTLKSGGRTLFIPAREFVRAKSAGNYIELYTIAGQHFVRLTLHDLAALLSDAGLDAVRVHRSHLVARDHIRAVGPSDLTLTSGETIPLGRSYRAAVA